jgi:hypothetical protein
VPQPRKGLSFEHHHNAFSTLFSLACVVTVPEFKFILYDIFSFLAKFFEIPDGVILKNARQILEMRQKQPKV